MKWNIQWKSDRTNRTAPVSVSLVRAWTILIHVETLHDRRKTICLQPRRFCNLALPKGGMHRAEKWKTFIAMTSLFSSLSVSHSPSPCESATLSYSIGWISANGILSLESSSKREPRLSLEDLGESKRCLKPMFSQLLKEMLSRKHFAIFHQGEVDIEILTWLKVIL